MRTRLIVATALAAALAAGTPAMASIYSVSYSTELSRTMILPPFGSYTSDVVFRQGSLASGQFLFDTEALAFGGDPAQPPRIHLENYRFFNDVDEMPTYIANEGWSVTPTDWTVDLEQSLVEMDAAGQLHFMLRAFRGLDMYSENRPFRFAGDTSMPKDLSWIAISDENSTWRYGGQERIGAVVFTVTQVAEPGTAALAVLALLAVGAARRRPVRWTCRRPAVGRSSTG